jgi:hypothetical protein
MGHDFGDFRTRSGPGKNRFAAVSFVGGGFRGGLEGIIHEYLPISAEGRRRRPHQVVFDFLDFFGENPG